MPVALLFSTVHMPRNDVNPGAQWLSGRELVETEGPRVRASPASLRCCP